MSRNDDLFQHRFQSFYYDGKLTSAAKPRIQPGKIMIISRYSELTIYILGSNICPLEPPRDRYWNLVCYRQFCKDDVDNYAKFSRLDWQKLIIDFLLWFLGLAIFRRVGQIMLRRYKTFNVQLANDQRRSQSMFNLTLLKPLHKGLLPIICISNHFDRKWVAGIRFYPTWC